MRQVDIRYWGVHSVEFSFFEGNHGDYSIYLSSSPSDLLFLKYKDNPHMQIVKLKCLPQKIQSKLVDLCLNYNSMDEIEFTFKISALNDEDKQWYVILHMPINISNVEELEIKSNVELESFHYMQYCECINGQPVKKLDNK